MNRLPLKSFKTRSLCDDIAGNRDPEILREGSIPVLETERLILRAPRLGDAKVVAALANDKRIAENTRRIPHPYKRADADDFITAVNAPGGEVAFLITLREGGAVVGGCGVACRTARRTRLLARRQILEQGLRHGGGARGGRFCLHRARARHALGRRARDQSGVAPRSWKNAASSGPASGSAASARSIRRRRSTASGSTAACGSRSKAGAPSRAWREALRATRSPSPARGEGRKVATAGPAAARSSPGAPARG